MARRVLPARQRMLALADDASIAYIFDVGRALLADIDSVDAVNSSTNAVSGRR